MNNAVAAYSFNDESTYWRLPFVCGRTTFVVSFHQQPKNAEKTTSFLFITLDGPMFVLGLITLMYLIFLWSKLVNIFLKEVDLMKDLCYF